MEPHQILRDHRSSHINSTRHVIAPVDLQSFNPSSMATCRVQHINKASSDELLSKFAELESDTDRGSSRKSNFRDSTRRKKPRSVCASAGCESPVGNNNLVEWKSLLSPSNHRRSGLFWQLRYPKSELKVIGIGGNRLLLAALEKSWRKTIKGASKMFIEKNSLRHVRLTDVA